MNLTDSDEELYKQLVDTLYAMLPRDRATATWIMNIDWAERIAAMRLPATDPVPAWASRPDRMLLGKPAKITEDGGEPHLEAEPQRAYIPAEPGQDVIYIKCTDPECPKDKPGYHHAHLER
jgi:hypothetical protein